MCKFSKKTMILVIHSMKSPKSCAVVNVRVKVQSYLFNQWRKLDDVNCSLSESWPSRENNKQVYE